MLGDLAIQAVFTAICAFSLPSLAFEIASIMGITVQKIEGRPLVEALATGVIIVLIAASPFVATVILNFIEWYRDKSSDHIVLTLTENAEKEPKEYYHFAICNKMDELDFNIEATAVRKYLDSLPERKRKAFIQTLGYQIGEWCKEWYNAGLYMDDHATTNNSMELKLIARYIPKEHLLAA